LTPWGAPHACAPALYDPARDRAIVVNGDAVGRVSTLDFKTAPNQPTWSVVSPSGATLGSRPGLVVGYDPDDDLVLGYGGVTQAGSADYDDAYRLDCGGGYFLDAGASDGSVVYSKWCYGSGEVASLIAAPNQGFKLNQWIGDASGNSNPLQLTMNGYKVVRAEFTTAVTAVEDFPTAFALSVRPNPAAGPAQIEYSLPHETAMKLRVFDVAGRQVADLVEGRQPAGRHVVQWGEGSAGRLRAGVYVVRFETPEGTWVKRVARLR
jgi:hypothetical protein